MRASPSSNFILKGPRISKETREPSRELRKQAARIYPLAICPISRPMTISSCSCICPRSGTRTALRHPYSVTSKPRRCSPAIWAANISCISRSRSGINVIAIPIRTEESAPRFLTAASGPHASSSWLEMAPLLTSVFLLPRNTSYLVLGAHDDIPLSLP